MGFRLFLQYSTLHEECSPEQPGCCCCELCVRPTGKGSLLLWPVQRRAFGENFMKLVTAWMGSHRTAGTSVWTRWPGFPHTHHVAGCQCCLLAEVPSGVVKEHLGCPPCGSARSLNFSAAGRECPRVGKEAEAVSPLRS